MKKIEIGQRGLPPEQNKWPPEKLAALLNRTANFFFLTV
jgi:hypothetical protein